jgi:hypothetical protein
VHAQTTRLAHTALKIFEFSFDTVALLQDGPANGKLLPQAEEFEQFDEDGQDLKHQAGAP